MFGHVGGRGDDEGLFVSLLPFCSFSLPPDSTPLGSMPVGVRPFSVSTLSLSSLERAKTNVTPDVLIKNKTSLKGIEAQKHALETTLQLTKFKLSFCAVALKTFFYCFVFVALEGLNVKGL